MRRLIERLLVQQILDAVRINRSTISCVVYIIISMSQKQKYFPIRPVLNNSTNNASMFMSNVTNTV